MTKTLTEQWRDGTLPEGCYYILDKNGHVKTERTCFYSYTDEQCFCFTVNRDVEKVLAPVPSYYKVKEMSQKIERLEFDNEALDNELKELATKNDTLAMENGRLEERLEIATKALKKLTRNCNKWEIAREALKEMEGVK